MGAGASAQKGDAKAAAPAADAASSDSLRSQLDTSRAESGRLAAKVTRLQAELEAKKAASKGDSGDADEVAILNSENAVFSKTLDTLQQEVTRLRIENENLKGDVKAKQGELTQALAESNSLALQLRTVRKQTCSVESDAAETQSSTLLGEQLFSYKLDSKDVSKLQAIQRRTHFNEVTAERLFDVFKANAGPDNTLDTRQFMAAIAQLGTVPPSQQFLFSRFYTLFDRDGDEKVDFGEFAGGLSVLCAGAPGEKLKLVFSFLDADGSGYLSRDELAAFMTTLLVVSKGLKQGTTLGGGEMESLEAQCRSEVGLVFDQVDKDSDGKLSYDEFDAGVNGADSSQLKDILSIFMAVSVEAEGAPEPEEDEAEEAEECTSQ